MSKELVSKNMVAIDIDDTLAMGVVKVHLPIYVQMLGLDMTLDQIEEGGLKYAKTFDVPEIKKYRARGDTEEKRFQEVRALIRTSSEVHLSFSPLPSAAAGVTFLTADKNVKFKGYYTVRPKEVKDATQQWLRQNQFPCQERTIICASHEDKLRKVMIGIFFHEKRDPIHNKKAVIVDDSIKQLVEAACSLAEHNKTARSLMKNIIIVGFGVDEANKNKLLEGVIYPELGLQTLSLPSWERLNVERLVHDLRTKQDS